MFPFSLSDRPPPLAQGALAAVVVVAIGTLVLYPLEDVAPAISLAGVYIPGVLLISTVWGLRLGLATAVLSAACFDWFHVPPTGRLDIAERADLVAVVVFAIVAVVSGTLAELARARASEAEHRRAEVARALADLERVQAERDRMAAEAIEAEALRRSDELKTSLLRAVSHDLRTPLTSIIAAGAALDSPSATPQERRELSEAVVEEGHRLSRLVENLIDVSRLESGRAEPRREPVDLEGVLEAARSSIGAGTEAVRLALDDDLPALIADPAQLERAFANLLDNAVVHGGGEQVLVRGRLVGRRLVVRVVDRGPGIPEGERARIFEPFYRSGGTGTGTGSSGSGSSGASGGPSAGSGLGLAIARGFVAANGGELEVESLPGQGSSFVVSFGATAARPAPAARAAAAPEPTA